jgi:hypothetical protein
MIKDIKKLLAYSLTDVDMRKVFKPKKINIILYQDLEKYKKIDDLFKNSNFNYCILFFPENEAGNVGHWIGILKHTNGTYEYFDPYEDVKGKDGIYTPDEERKWLSKKIIKKLELEEPALTNLFIASGVKSIMCNPYAFQEEANGISTCGRHICCRLKHSKLTIDEYWNMIKKSGNNPDVFVTEYIYKLIKK